jgi:hypothetical protein
LCQIKKLLFSKGNNFQNEEKTYRMEDKSLLFIGERNNIQNTELQKVNNKRAKESLING